MYPSKSFLHLAEVMNKEFAKFHGDGLSKESKIFDTLTDIVYKKVPSFAREVIACLVRTRTYVRLRQINKNIINNNNQKKSTKMYKLSNKENVYK